MQVCNVLLTMHPYSQIHNVPIYGFRSILHNAPFFAGSQRAHISLSFLTRETWSPDQYWLKINWKCIQRHFRLDRHKNNLVTLHNAPFSQYHNVPIYRCHPWQEKQGSVAADQYCLKERRKCTWKRNRNFRLERTKNNLVTLHNVPLSKDHNVHIYRWLEKQGSADQYWLKERRRNI
jgi:hypothetical protein